MQDDGMESPLHDFSESGIARMDVESVSDATTALSEVKLSNKERIYEECFEEFKRFLTNLTWWWLSVYYRHNLD